MFLLCIFITICTSSYGQKRSYLFIGAEAEILNNPEPWANIFDDYNAYHSEFDITTQQKPVMPLYVPSFMMGFKIHSWFTSFGANAHFVRYKTFASGTDFENVAYDKEMIYYHNGLSVHLHVNWINTNYFRTGPGIGIMLDQYKMRITDNTIEEFSTTYPVDRALVLGRAYYSISFGGPKFNFDIIGFYNIPFHTLNLRTFNERLNDEYHTDYPTEELEFKPTVIGITVAIGLGSRDNYDF